MTIFQYAVLKYTFGTKLISYTTHQLCIQGIYYNNNSFEAEFFLKIVYESANFGSNFDKNVGLVKSGSDFHNLRN